MIAPTRIIGVTTKSINNQRPPSFLYFTIAPIINKPDNSNRENSPIVFLSMHIAIFIIKV